MDWALIEEDAFYKEETTVTDSYYKRGVYYEGDTIISYKTIYGTGEPYQDGTESIMLPSGASSTDAMILYSSEALLTYDDVGQDISLADKLYLKNPEVGKNKPQRYVVMNKEDWGTNSGFVLIQDDASVMYLVVKEEKVVKNGS